MHVVDRILNNLKHMLTNAPRQSSGWITLQPPWGTIYLSALPVHHPYPLLIPECRQMWKVKYHPRGEGLLFNNHYTIMDTHLTFFFPPSLFICHLRALLWKSHTHTALVTLSFSIFLFSFMPFSSPHSQPSPTIQCVQQRVLYIDTFGACLAAPWVRTAL